jgi:negative regulator of replication initiation
MENNENNVATKIFDDVQHWRNRLNSYQIGDQRHIVVGFLNIKRVCVSNKPNDSIYQSRELC